jgi:hypothetical protein
MEKVNETVNIVYLMRAVHHMSIYDNCRHFLSIPPLEQHTTKVFSFFSRYPGEYFRKAPGEQSALKKHPEKYFRTCA